MSQHYRCIWCTQKKPEEEFNREHVVPEAFGTFEQNFTLVHVVCAACNGFFSRELEPWLTRDSLEGFERYNYGQKPTTDFKSQGKRSTARVQLSEGPYAGAWGYSVPGEEALGVRPFPQIGFSPSKEGPFEWFMLSDLPAKDDLLAKGFSGDIHTRLCECNPAEVIELLAARGIKCTLTESFDPSTGRAWVEHVFRPGVPHRRALAKIALNYVAHQFGATIALEPRFDPIRALVMAGTEPTYKYFDVDENPIVTWDKQDGKRLFGHALVVRQRDDQVEAIVSLYNRLRHGYLLALGPGTYLEPRGHFFDISNRAIHPMGPS